MGPENILPSLWSGLFAAMMGAIFSAPRSALLPCFIGGFAARLSRDMLLAQGASQELATVLASAMVVLTATLLIRRPGISPVVMISGVLPISASAAFFRAIIGFLRLSSTPADESSRVVLELVTNLSRVFTTTLAIAVGISAALLAVRSIRTLAGLRKAVRGHARNHRPLSTR
jgi:uncharacterized membrane protein YjjB (DUF3815 family)